MLLSDVTLKYVEQDAGKGTIEPVSGKISEKFLNYPHICLYVELHSEKFVHNVDSIELNDLDFSEKYN